MTSGGVSGGSNEHDAVGYYIESGIRIHKVQTFGVFISAVDGVKLIHLLLRRGYEYIAVCAFLYLGL